MAPLCMLDEPALLRERSSASASSSSFVLFALAFFALPFFLGVRAVAAVAGFGASRAEVRPLREDGLGARCDVGGPRCDVGGPRCEIGGRAGLLFRGVGILPTLARSSKKEFDELEVRAVTVHEKCRRKFGT